MYSRYISLAIPSVAEMVLISLISMMDTVMVSSIGTDAVAAVGLATQPRLIMLCVFFALNTAITSVVARRKGEDRREDANSTVRTAILMLIGVSLLLMAALLPLADPLMRFAGAEEGRTLSQSAEYFVILGLVLPFQALSMGMCAAQRGVGNTKLTMQVNIVSNLVNILFNWLLINGIGPFPKLGIRGAAIATGIGIMVGFVLSLIAMFRNSDGFLRLTARDDWRPQKDAAKALLKVASSAMVEQAAIRVGFFVYARIVAGLGTDAFAAHQICCQFLNLSFGFADGLAIAGTSLVGQMLGQKRPDLAHIYGVLMTRFSLVISIVIAALCIAFRHPLIGIFIHSSDSANVRTLAESVMIIMGLIQPMQMNSYTYSGSLRGAGDVGYTARVMLTTVTILRPICAVTFIYLAVNVFHSSDYALIGAWLATLSDTTARTVLMRRRFNSCKWHTIKI